MLTYDGMMPPPPPQPALNAPGMVPLNGVGTAGMAKPPLGPPQQQQQQQQQQQPVRPPQGVGSHTDHGHAPLPPLGPGPRPEGPDGGRPEGMPH